MYLENWWTSLFPNENVVQGFTFLRLLTWKNARHFYYFGGAKMKKSTSLLLAAVMTFGMTTTAFAEEAAVVNTVILKEADDSMINTYSVLTVNPEAPFVDADGNAVEDVTINTEGADALAQWLLSKEALDMAADFGVAEYNEHLFYVKDDAPVYEGEIAAATDETKTVRLSTTTSVNDSGLLGYLLPVFEEEYGYSVEIQSAGTGKAIAEQKLPFISRGDGSGTHTKELSLWPEELCFSYEHAFQHSAWRKR